LNFSSFDDDIDPLVLSKALQQAPFLRSLTFNCENLDLSSLPFSSLESFSLSSGNGTGSGLPQVLANSNPKNLTNLEMSGDRIEEGGFQPLAAALLECRALTRLSLVSSYGDVDILPIVQILPRLPGLITLCLDLEKYTDESIECLLSFLLSSSSSSSSSPSAAMLQDLKLGTLSPKQLQLVAEALPSLPSLRTLAFDTIGFVLCEHEQAHLALFSALTSSSLSSLSLRYCSFRSPIFEACMDKIPHTRLSSLLVKSVNVYAEGFDPFHHDQFYQRADLSERYLCEDYLKLWNNRFPQYKEDRFCYITIYSRW
jgi:hypothetical protein